AISRSRWRAARSTACRSGSPSAATWSRSSPLRKARWGSAGGSPKRSLASSPAAAAASAPSANMMTATMAVAEGFAPAWSPPRSRAAPTRAQRREAEGLAAELARRIAGEVRFDRGSRALYATDLSIYRQVPIGVVIPKSAEDVEATVAACRARGVPILGRGCGTSLSGQTCNVAVVLDFSKYMNRILALDPDGRRARVEPGVINDELRAQARRYGLTFAPDPATHKYCTIGGNIGNNSCGVHTVLGGKTVDNVEELEVLTYDGLRLRVGAAAAGAPRSIARSAPCATATAMRSGGAIPTSRAASPATISTTSCRRRASMSRALWSARRALALSRSQPRCASFPGRGIARCCS